MDDSIRKMLKANYVDGVFHTHVSLIQPKGKFTFNRTALEEFWKLYCDAVAKGDATLGVAEKPQNYVPVLGDIDIKIRDTGGDYGERLYSEEQLKTVVEVYQSVLRKIVDDCSQEDLICVVLEKNMYIQKVNDVTYFKHGFHIHFPYCFLSKVDQEIHLIPRVKDQLNELKVFQTLGVENSGDLVDKSSCSVPWLLYGSRKSLESQAYKVSTIYDSELNKISVEKAFRKYQLFDNQEEQIPLKGNVEHLLPRILSIIPYGRATREVKKGLICPQKEKKKEKKPQQVYHEKISVDEALKIAKRLMPMLSDHRVQDYNEWLTIGWCLYNISNGSSEGLELWCDFSARSEDKYDEAECIYQWERMTKKDMSLGTLRYFASMDNPEEYKKFKEEQIGKHVKESLDGSHNDIAKVLNAEYGDQFVCSSISNERWFQFIGHKWEEIEEGVFLREKISGPVVDLFVDSFKKLAEQLGACGEDKGAQALINAKIKQVQKIITNLKSANYKNSVMREACEVFYDRRFEQKLDTDPFKICFKNGVYDLKLNVMRRGRPEDFLSKSMPIDYIEFSPDDEKVKAVFEFLEQVFPDRSVRQYFLDVSSDLFVGGNHQKTIHFWTGEGDNGKSVTQKFFELMFGPLAVKMDTGVVTGKKPSAGSAFADLTRIAGGVRLATLEEPNGDEQLNIGTLKHLSGNDSITARDLFQKGKDMKEITPLMKIVFICNKLPRLKHNDKAIWNRIRVIPFESTFCRPENPAPETYEEQLQQKRFPMDKQFAQKIPDLVEAFTWILLEHRKTLTVRNEPPRVREATEFYRKQNDIYKQFTEEQLAEDKNASISLNDIYALFRDWFKDGMPGQVVPVKSDVEDYFTTAWGNPSKRKIWMGYRPRGIDDDVKDGNAEVLDENDFVEYEE